MNECMKKPVASEIQRHTFGINFDEPEGTYIDHAGEYVLHSDHIAQVTELRRELESANNRANRNHDNCIAALRERDALAARLAYVEKELHLSQNAHSYSMKENSDGT